MRLGAARGTKNTTKVNAMKTSKGVNTLQKLLQNCSEMGAGTMMQQLSMHAALAEGQALRDCNCSFGISNTLFWSPRAVGTKLVHIHTYRQTHKPLKKKS